MTMEPTKELPFDGVLSFPDETPLTSLITGSSGEPREEAVGEEMLAACSLPSMTPTSPSATFTMYSDSEPFPLPAPFSSSYTMRSLLQTPSSTFWLPMGSLFGDVHADATPDHRPCSSSDSVSRSLLTSDTKRDKQMQIAAQGLLALQPTLKNQQESDGVESSTGTRLRGAEVNKKPSYCNCKNSKCLKLYCVCFSSGICCDTTICSCQDCHNMVESLSVPPRTHALNCMCSVCRRTKLEKKDQLTMGEVTSNHSCKCKSSHCLKLYCACFQSGSLCNDRCKCISCLNSPKENVPNGARQKAVASCLERRMDAFDSRTRKRGAGTGCACIKSMYVDYLQTCTICVGVRLVLTAASFVASVPSSRCLKKYCNCFARGTSCMTTCSCQDCLNTTTRTESHSVELK